MMISSEMYAEQFKDATYKEMIKERDGLIRYIRKFEKLEKAGDRSGEEWMIHPQPDVRYQMYMEYLAALLLIMKDKYNEEYVWGDKKLSYEAVVRSLSGLRLKKNVLKETSLNSREYIQKELDLDKKNVAENLRQYFYEKEKME